MLAHTDKQEFLKILKQAIKFSGCRQSEIAQRIGLNPSVFSCKLNNNKASAFTAPEIKQIILQLVAENGINHRDEVFLFLNLAGLRDSAFTQDDWQRLPLKELS